MDSNASSFQELETDQGEVKQKLTVDIETDNDVKLTRSKKEERRAYIHRLLHTVCVCCSMFALGWRNALVGPTFPDLRQVIKEDLSCVMSIFDVYFQGWRNALVGPTFPDLRQIIKEDLSTASWIFTAISLGGLIGSVIGGVAYDRFNKTFVFIFIMCGLGSVASLAPWCTHFIAMFVVHVFHGAFASALDTAATTDVTVIWRHESGPFMQAIHGTFSVGAIISPFICKPFLAKKLSPQDANTTLQESVVTTVHTLYAFNNSDVYIHDNRTETRDSMNDVIPSRDQTINGGSDMQSVYGPTYIYIPYFMATFVCLVAVSLYFILYLTLGNVYERSIITSTSTDVNTHGRKYFLSKRMKIVFTILVALSLATYVMSERCFVGFLMTFIITKVGWSKARGSIASSVFWIAFATGRLSGIVIVKWVRLSNVIIAFFSLITTGAVLMWTAVVYDVNALMWVSIAVIGYGMSVIFASMFSWLSENIRRLTGKMASILFIFLSTGAMLFPILEGHLMDKVSLMWFVYSLLILSIVMIILFLIVVILFNILQKEHVRSKENEKLNEIKS